MVGVLCIKCSAYIVNDLLLDAIFACLHPDSPRRDGCTLIKLLSSLGKLFVCIGNNRSIDRSIKGVWICEVYK